MTVLLDGQGADEVLGGYRPFALWLGGMLRAGRLAQAARRRAAIQAVTGLNPLPLLARAAAQQMPAAVQLPALRRAAAAGGRPGGRCGPTSAQPAAERAAGRRVAPVAAQRNLHDHLARLVVEDSLPTLLRYEDRNSMAFSIEARVPFLDYRLVEFAFRPGARPGGCTTAGPSGCSGGRLLIYCPRPWSGGATRWASRRRKCTGCGPARRRLLDLFATDDGAGDYLDLAQVRAAVPRLLARGRRRRCGAGRIWCCGCGHLGGAAG